MSELVQACIGAFVWQVQHHSGKHVAAALRVELHVAADFPRLAAMVVMPADMTECAARLW
jgi:hypothetical protein